MSSIKKRSKQKEALPLPIIYSKNSCTIATISLSLGCNT